MRTEEYKKLRELETSYWWHVGRRIIIRSILQKYLAGKGTTLQILDAGCGTGGNAKLLSEYGDVVGLDNSQEALRFAQNEPFSALVHGEVVALPFTSQSIDCVTLFDVLEHIDDDGKALGESFRVLKPGGSVVITVPAYQWLWSGHDEALGHRRRYSAKEIIRKLSHVGFKITFKSYVIISLFAPMVVYRVLERVIRHTQKTSYVTLPFLNEFFVQLLRLEARMLQFGFRFPFGTSILIHASKP